MSRESLVLLLGLLIIFVPVIGVPLQWKQYVLLVIGLLLVVVGYSLRRSAYLRRTDKGGGERGTDSFLESQPSLLDTPDASNSNSSSEEV